MTINFKVGKFWTHLCLIWSRSLTTAQSTAIPANIFFRYAGSGKKEVEELESHYLNLMFRLLWSKICYIKNIFRKTFSFYSIWFVYIKMWWKIIFQCLFCRKRRRRKKKKKTNYFSKPTECKHSHTLPLNYHQSLGKKTKFHSQQSKHQPLRKKTKFHSKRSKHTQIHA